MKGISFVMIRFLHVATAAPISCGDAARALDVDHSHASHTARRLARRGWLKMSYVLEGDAGGERGRRYQTTPEGTEIVEAARKALAQ